MPQKMRKRTRAVLSIAALSVICFIAAMMLGRYDLAAFALLVAFVGGAVYALGKAEVPGSDGDAETSGDLSPHS